MKRKESAGAIDVSGLPTLAGAREFLRMWSGKDGPATCLIDPAGLGADPFLFGIAMVDCIRHGAKAYAHAVNISEEHALARIWQGFEAERAHKTSEPTPLTGKRN
jgi:hypothetical protein